MNKVKLTEQILLEEIKELVDNTILYPNRIILDLLLKLPSIFKEKINEMDIPLETKKYYHRIIDNPDLLNEDNDSKSNKSIKSDKKVKEENKRVTTFNITDFINFTKTQNKPKIKYNDEKLYNKEFPKYSSLNTTLFNYNFKKLESKIMFY